MLRVGEPAASAAPSGPCSPCSSPTGLPLASAPPRPVATHRNNPCLTLPRGAPLGKQARLPEDPPLRPITSSGSGNRGERHIRGKDRQLDHLATSSI